MMSLSYRLQEERADAQGMAHANCINLKDHLLEGEERIQQIINKEIGNDRQNEQLRTIRIYQCIAFSNLTKFSIIKLTMKFISANKLLDMLKTTDQSILRELNESDHYDMNKYVCDNCTSLGAIYKCSGCMKAKYCSKSCQTFDRKFHKMLCYRQGNPMPGIF